MKLKRDDLEKVSDKWLDDNNYKPLLEVEIKKSKFYEKELSDFLMVSEADRDVTY